MQNEVEFLVEGQQLVKRHDRILAEVSGEFGMNKTELAVLMFLSENPEKDTARDIVEGRLLTKSCVSKTIDSLVRQDYLITREDPGDRRVLHLEIQEKAREAARAGVKAQKDMMTVLEGGITDQEKEVFFQILQKILKNIKEL